MRRQRRQWPGSDRPVVAVARTRWRDQARYLHAGRAEGGAARAQSGASIPASATGYSIAKVFDRLGITEAMKAKMKAQPTPAEVVAVVAKGEADLALFLMLIAPGLDVVGPFPADVQQDVVFTAAPASETKEGDAAKALIAYLKSPDAIAIFKAKGMTPG